MKRVLAVAAVIVALLVTCLMFTPLESAAEPITGEASLVAPSGATTQMQEVVDALALFKVGDYDGALELWKEAVKKNKDLPPAQAIMAQLFLQAKMPEEAQKALKQAVVDAPGDPEVYLHMAIIAMRERDIAKAEAFYEKANGMMSAFETSAKRKALLQPQIYGGLSKVKEVRGDLAGAQEVIRDWLKLDPSSVEVLQRLAYCLFQQKDVEGALERLRAASKTDGDMLTPEAVLAQFYERSGDRENARKWMAAALAAAPKDLKTHLAVGEWAFGTGQFGEARKQAIAAIQIAPASLPAFLLRGSVALVEKDYTTAEFHFESALKRWPRDLAISNNLAIALIEQGDESKSRRALEYAEANVRQFPELAEAASTYGLVLYRLGRLDDAEKVLCSPVCREDSSVDAAYIAACLAVDRGRRAEARELLENALKRTEPSMFRQEAEELLKQLKK